MISFIIATRNEEKALPRTLSSLARYAGPHEIIVGDDKSTDGTVAAARQQGALVVQNPGAERITIAANRNAAAAHAKGELFAFADADSYVLDANDFFPKVEKLFQNDPRLNALTFFNHFTPALETRTDRFFLAYFNWSSWFMNLIGFGVCTGKLQVIRASAFHRVGGYNPQIVAGEDVELFRRLARIGHARAAPSSLVVYHSGRRQHAFGWLRLILQWGVVASTVFFFKRNHVKEWQEVR